MIGKINRWNYETHNYDKLIYDCNKFKFKTYSSNMNEIVNCPHCFKEFRYGTGYTSLEFHTDFGFGYTVCDKCYTIELERRSKYKDCKRF